MHSADDPHAPDASTDAPVPAADAGAHVAWHRALNAVRGAALYGFAYVVCSGLWLWWVLHTAAHKTAEMAALEDGVARYDVSLHLLIVTRDPRLVVPTAAGFAVVLLGPFLAALGAVWLWRARRRTPERAGRPLALLAGGAAFSVLPGLMTQIQLTTEHARGGGSAGLGPAPMCGGLALLIAAQATWVLLHHAPVLRAGPPPGTPGAD